MILAESIWALPSHQSPVRRIYYLLFDMPGVVLVLYFMFILCKYGVKKNQSQVLIQF